jgi:predicted dehydrogenase
MNATSEQDPDFEFLYYEITGHAGHQLFSHDGDLVYHRKSGDDVRMSMGAWHSNRRIDWWGYFEDVRNFLAATRGDEPDRCPVADTIRTMELGEEIARLCYGHLTRGCARSGARGSPA